MNNAQASLALTPGRGTVGFNADSNECYGRVRRNDGSSIVVKGTYSGEVAQLEGLGTKVNLAKAVATKNGNGPRMRGSVVFTDTGEIIPITLWAPKNAGATGYGLTDDAPFVAGTPGFPF